MRVIDNKISALILKGLEGEAFDRKLSKRDRVVSDGSGHVAVFLWNTKDRKSTRLNSSHSQQSRMPSSA